MRVSTFALALLSLRQVTAAPAPALDIDALALQRSTLVSARDTREPPLLDARDARVFPRSQLKDPIYINAEDHSGHSVVRRAPLAPREMEKWTSAHMERVLKFTVPNDDGVKYNIPNDTLVWETGLYYQRQKTNGTVQHLVIAQEITQAGTVASGDSKLCFTSAVLTAWEDNVVRITVGLSFNWLDRISGYQVPIFWTIDVFFTKEITTVAGWEQPPTAYAQENGDVTTCPSPDLGTQITPVDWSFNCWGDQCLPKSA